MSAGRIERLRPVVQRIRCGLGARRILLYHRVTAQTSDPYLLCISPQHFAEHLEVLRKGYQVIPLKRLVRGLLEGNAPRRAVVLTFDDGYADNLYEARPLLDRYNIPATVFVTTCHIDQEEEFWWDELERLLLLPGMLPETLQLHVKGNIYRWRLGEAARYDEDSHRANRSWNVELDDPGPRQAAFRGVYDVLQPLSSGARRQALGQLRQWAGSEGVCRPTHGTLSSDEVLDLADGGLVEIGSHTVTHPVLSTMPEEDQRDEIQRSKAHLQHILGYPVTSFSYPFGLRSTYTQETVAAVREASFACACSNFPKLIGKDTDPFQLPRFVVQDWDGDTFARLLREEVGE